LGPAQEEAFVTLKEKLITAPILASPTDDGEYVLDTDASLMGLGAVLQQQQGEHLRVIAYGSRSLSKAERNYSTTRRELLAVVYGLKQYRQFLLGRHFKLRVDHAALTYLRKTPEVMGQAARWMDLIEEYDFDIIHRAGVAHGNCDALSRRPESDREATPTVSNPVLTQDKATAADTMQSLLRNMTERQQTGLEDIATVQQADPALKPLMHALKVNGSRPDWSEVQAMPEETRILWAQYDSLELVDGVLVRKFYGAEGTVMHKQIVMPEALRAEFLKEIHQPDLQSATSHLGVRKTQEHVMRRAYWTTWKKDTEKYCRRCIVCQSLKHGPAPRHGRMRVNEANGFGDLLNIDLTGPHPPSRQGCRYILTAMDAYTRFLIAVPLRNKTAETVATALVNSAFIPYGCWLRLNSDQGGEFSNAVLQHVTRLLNIHKTRTTAYRPQSNGRCERVHRTINDLMAKVVSDSQRDWQDRLPMIVAAYNAAHHETIGHSPYYLVFGHEYRIPLDLVLAIGGTEKEEDRHEYADQLRERIQDAYRLVNEKLKTTTERMKRRYDVKVKPIQFEIGQLALYYCPRKQVGKNQKWRRLQRLCIIVKKLNDVLYCVKLGPRAESTVVHVDRLFKFCGDPPPKWKQYVNKQSTNELGRCTGENNKEPIDASNDAKRDEYGQPASCAGRTVTTTSPPTGDASPAAARPQDVTLCEPGSPAGCRPQRIKHKPHRYRDVNCRQIQIGQSAYAETETERSRTVVSRDRSTLSKINMDAIAGSGTSQKVRKTRKRSQKEKEKRRHREKGPHPCPLCDHAPFKSISGLRAHVIGVHRKHCSWTKKISDLKPADVIAGVYLNDTQIKHIAYYI
jgi:transposase InsO family protein